MPAYKLTKENLLTQVRAAAAEFLGTLILVYAGKVAL